MNRFSTLLHVAGALFVLMGASVAMQAKQTAWMNRTSIPRSTEALAPIQRNTLDKVYSAVDAEETRVSTELPLFRTRTPKSVDAVQAALPGVEVGYTYYDFQTNGSMPNRLAYYTDGADHYIQMLWMTSKDSTRDGATRIPGFAGNARGTHYTYLEVGTPDSPVLGMETWEKIETLRAGWPCIVKYADGLIGTPSHTPVRFYGNTGVGDPPDLHKEVTTAADSAVWARAAADGQGNTHLIYNRTIVGTGGAANQLAYRRSVDGGFTWGTEILFTGATAPEGSMQSGWGADTYAVTARGGKAVIAYTDGSLRLFTRTSTDGGATWPSDLARVVFSPQYTDIDSGFNADGTFEVRSDTVPSPNGHIDVIIDSNGVTHLVVGVVFSFVTRKDTNGMRSGIISVVDPRIYSREVGMAYTKDGETNLYFMAPPCGSKWDGSGFLMNQRFFDGLSRWPQLGVSAKNDLYCLYGSFNNGDTKNILADTTGGIQQNEVDTLVQVDALNGHVWATYLSAGTLTWSPPTDLTPIGMNCQYGTLADDVVNNRLYIGYSASSQPGDCVTNVELPANAAKVMMVAYDAALLTPVNSVQEYHDLNASISISPNPARDIARMHIVTVTAGPMSVSLVSTLGEIIMTSQSPSSQSEWDLNIITQTLAVGTYHCIIEQNGARSILPLVVVR